MQVGVDQGYMPVQPIHYSHKIHAGANQIECKYCHSSARVSKHSGIPSLNVCMNCHQNIAEYNGEEDLENGYTKDFYTKEIKKLYAAVGWDEENQQYTGETEPVKWVVFTTYLILLLQPRTTRTSRSDCMSNMSRTC